MKDVALWKNVKGVVQLEIVLTNSTALNNNRNLRPKRFRGHGSASLHRAVEVCCMGSKNVKNRKITLIIR